MSGLSTTPDSCILSRRSTDAANVFRRVRASPAYLVAGVLMVLAVMVSPSMVPINSTCCPA